MTKFHDASIRPPRGGWVYVVGGQQFTGYSESELIEAIGKWRRNNATYSSDESIAHEIWDYFCRREPERCGGVYTRPGDALSPLGAVPAEKTPKLQGPPIWLFLNTLAAQWVPALHDYFLATCDAISSILDCPDCRAEWQQILGSNPPAGLTTRLAVCQWVNRVHNLVNAKTGKLPFAYSRMVTEFGAPNA